MNGGKKSLLNSFLRTLEVKLLCKKSKQKNVKRFPMGDSKSSYVIRFYEHSECNYLVRKVSKRTSKDFL